MVDSSHSALFSRTKAGNGMRDVLVQHGYNAVISLADLLRCSAFWLLSVSRVYHSTSATICAAIATPNIGSSSLFDLGWLRRLLVVGPRILRFRDESPPACARVCLRYLGAATRRWQLGPNASARSSRFEARFNSQWLAEGRQDYHKVLWAGRVCSGTASDCQVLVTMSNAAKSST